MRRCPAPCIGKISREEYLKLVNEIILFLKGEKKGLLEELDKKMLRFAEETRFEDAAKIRDRIKALQRAWESQKVVAPELGDLDIIGYCKADSMVCFEVFFIRNGIMIGSKDLTMKNIENLTDKKLMHSFISQFYSKEIIPPSDIITPFLPAGVKSLEKWLKQRKEEAVKISVPETGKKKELLLMASENAKIRLKEKRETKVEDILMEIKEKLGLEKSPDDIGAFDVSTISGNESVGAFVYWKGGEFSKDLYRRLRIKTVQGIDDYSMIGEIVERIIQNLDGNMPDLIIIDGGKGQLEVAKRVLDKHSVLFPEPPMIIAIAKDPDRAFMPDSKEPVDLNDGTSSSLLLKRIRDEAHRFAIGYHRKLRGKGLMESPLEKIPGIGKKRRLALLRHFGSIEAIRNATIDEITKLKGFHKGIAENLLHALRRA
jgi:excinuclease ABC subunit C